MTTSFAVAVACDLWNRVGNEAACLDQINVVCYARTKHWLRGEERLPRSHPFIYQRQSIVNIRTWRLHATFSH